MGKPDVFSLFEQDTFEARFPDCEIIGRPGHLFVECVTYDLRIPVNAPEYSELNIFEETVLRVLNLRMSSAEELARQLCLTRDLVNLILIRLQENGFLSDPYTLTERGKAQLGQQLAQRKEIRYQTAKLFCIPKTGQLLPYIHLGELRRADVVDYKSGITLEFGSAGRPYTVRGSYVTAGTVPERPSQQKCRQAIRIYNRLAAAREKEKIQTVPGYAIDISLNGRIFFHLQAAVQRGNVNDMLVSDGFVRNVDGLADYIEEADPKLLSRIREKNASVQLSGGEAEVRTDTRKYPELAKLYRVLRDRLQKPETEPELTPDAGREENARRKRFLSSCGEFLEWAFYYYTRERPVSEQMRRQLENSGSEENRRLLTGLARRIGLNLPPEYEYLFAQVDRSRVISTYQRGTPVLYTCLSFAVAEASENGDSRMYRLKEAEPELLAFLDEICGVHRKLRHEVEMVSYLRDLPETALRCARIALILLPDLSLEGVEPPKRAEDVSVDRLSARVALERAMGSIFFASLDPACQDEWITISPDKSGSRLPDPYYYVNTLYRLLQRAVCDALAGLERTCKSKDEAVRLAEAHWDGSLPASLTTVGEKKFQSALRGGNSTLGAAALLLLASAEKPLLEQLRETGFVALVDRILGLRVHANNVGLQVDEEELEQLRAQTIESSKRLGGF